MINDVTAGEVMTDADEEHFFVIVPHDKPAESFAMVSRWLAGKEL